MRLHRVPVLEAHAGVLGEERVADGESAALEAGQRHVLLARGVVDQHRVALGERAPPGVLPGQPHVGALHQQRTDGQGLAQRPVDLPVGDHLVPLLELAGQLGVHDEPVGDRSHHLGQPGEHHRLHTGLHRRGRQVGDDVGGQLRRGPRAPTPLRPGSRPARPGDGPRSRRGPVRPLRWRCPPGGRVTRCRASAPSAWPRSVRTSTAGCSSGRRPRCDRGAGSRPCR